MLTLVPWIQAGLLAFAYGLFTAWCYRDTVRLLRRRATPQQHTTLVAYASEGGMGAGLARQLTEQLREQGADSVCLPLNALRVDELTGSALVLIIASTYGEGEAPDNGRRFLHAVQRSAGRQLPSFRFLVLALGDRNYSQFCAFGLAVHQQLQAAGALALTDPIQVDRGAPEAIDQWWAGLQRLGILTAGSDWQATQVDTMPCQLAVRQVLNPGSPGADLCEVTFTTQRQVSWQAGDIARLHLQGETRDYTIATLPEEQRLTLLVREQTNAEGQPGLGSGYLCRHLAIGETALFSLHSLAQFHAPDPARPLILIGNGTGLAGLRVHLKQREFSNSHVNWILYGERTPQYDRPWRTELEHWMTNKHLQYLDLAYSRNADAVESVTQGSCYWGYVQHILLEQSDRLQDWIEQGAAVYVCGSRVGMAEGVEDALRRVLGQSVFNRLAKSGRYCRDVY